MDSSHYGPLNGLARNRINTRLITDDWDEICRLTASLRAGTVIPSAIMRMLQRGPSASSLARALAELGRVRPCTCCFRASLRTYVAARRHVPPDGRGGDGGAPGAVRPSPVQAVVIALDSYLVGPVDAVRIQRVAT